MSKKPFSRGQTQIFYRFLPGAIFEHDDYGFCKVEEVLTDDVEVNKTALFDTLVDALQKWSREEFRARFPDPRSERGRRMYKIGQPREVFFNPFPTVLQCRDCRHIADYERIPKTGRQPGYCPRCSGRMQQMRFVEIHNCGRMEKMHVPTKGCQEHGHAYIQFHDTGRAHTSRWVCGICHREMQKPRMTPCNCEYSNSGVAGGAERFLRLYPLSEPGVFIPHVVAFVNFPEENERRLHQVEEGHPLMLSRLWGILDRNVLEVIEERKRWSPSASSEDNLKEVLKALEAVDPNNELLKRFKDKKNNPPGQNEIDRVKNLLEGSGLSAAAPRKLVEHISLLDSMNVTGIGTVVNRLREQHNEELADRFMNESRSAVDILGIEGIEVVNDFPIALTALGYTRITRDTHRSVFNPFPAPADDNRLPLFVLPTETEGLWFHLDPAKVAAWLIENGFGSGEVPKNRLDAWVWLHRNAVLYSFASPEDKNPAALALESLLHTMSHILLQKIEWSGFASSSIGEYLMPETLSFIIYANRFAEAKIGGLTTLFEQRLPMWLLDAAQSGGECVYDPLCGEDGGSCAGCLHREHNCPFFNRQMSRAYLYGGVLPQDEHSVLRRIDRGYWSDYWNLVYREKMG